MPDTIETGGSVSTGTPAPTGVAGPEHSLGEFNHPNPNPPPLPGSQPQSPLPKLPLSWTDPVTIMFEVLRVFREEGPAKAQKLIDFLNSLRG